MNATFSEMLSRWLLASVTLCVYFGASDWLNGQASQTRIATESQPPIIDFQALQKSQKNEYQADLIKHGLRFEPQLVRLDNLILLSTAVQDFLARSDYIERARIHNEALYGKLSPLTWDAHLAQKSSSDWNALDQEQKDLLAKAAQLYLQVDERIVSGKPEAALANVLSAIELRTNVLGPSHPEVGKSILDAALLIESQGLGPLPLTIRQRAWQMAFDDQPDYLFFLRGLSGLLYRQSDHASAEQVLRKTLEQLHNLKFEKSEMHVSVLVELGTLFYMTGDYITAKDRLLEALDLQRELNQPSSSNHSTCLHTLALVLLELGEFDSAKQYFEVSLRLDEHLLGPTSPDFWLAKIRFAWLLYKANEFDRAWRTADEALRQLETLGSTSNSAQALALTVLGKSLQGLGELDDAEAKFREALRLVSDSRSQKSLDRYLGVLLNNLAKCLQVRRQFDEASQVYRQAIIKTKLELDRQSANQSERQQIAFSSSLKYQLDNYLTCVLDSKINDNDPIISEAYEQVFGWKGSVLVRQRQMRQFIKSGRAVDVFSELQRATIELSKLSNSVPEDAASLPDWQKKIQIADECKESLQRQLSQLTTDYLDADATSMSLKQLQELLPEDVILIDYLVIRSSKPRLVAFMIQSQSAVQMIDLGSMEPIESAIEEWRSDIQSRLKTSPAPLRLRALIWNAIEAKLPNASTLLVSTDGALGRISFAALPGKARDRYLIEEQKIAMLPVPQLLPSILKHPAADDQAQRLLTLGDADFECENQNQSETSTTIKKRSITYRALATRRFGPLQETEREIDRIEELFQDAFQPSKDNVRRLTKANASEAQFRAEAPHCTLIHLATHGFFAEPSIVAAEISTTSDTELPVLSRSWRGMPTGLLSGLAFSGANQPWRSNDSDDGILTADEIASMPLEHVQLIVLSACETGLGKSAAAEGMLGIQRAFQVSGARTTISSLWSVSDLGTRLLMDRFYENLWQRKLNRLDAFREAQLYMLGKSKADPSAEHLRAAIVDLPKATIQPENPNQQSSTVNDFSHPFYWAAFNLAGDWQ